METTDKLVREAVHHVRSILPTLVHSHKEMDVYEQCRRVYETVATQDNYRDLNIAAQQLLVYAADNLVATDEWKEQAYLIRRELSDLVN